jgi:hypothetical protein
MRSPAEAYRVIEEIQKLYYLYPNDILFRQQNPQSRALVNTGVW